MKSPFPGMDPFIEVSDLWDDFAHSLICAIAHHLGEVLPERYAPRIGAREYTALCYSEADCIYPTPAHVLAACAPQAGPKSPKGKDEPMWMRAFFDEQHRERFVRIQDLSDENRPVTFIEVLSPSNKRRGSEGWQQYLRKRQALLLGKANLVELDLLRGGDRMPMLDPWPASPYTLLVAREERAPRCRVWPAFFDRPLPTIPIPLAKPHPDIPLALQPLIEVIYERGRYSEDIDYAKPLDPPLTAEQSAWFEQQLRGREAVGKARPARSRRSRRSSG
jgi:hypothetical protein